MLFTPVEQAILRRVQQDLPDTATPYADLAAQVVAELGVPVSEAEVLALLSRLKETGAIRRFGASIKHQRTGWNSNFMVAWITSSEEEADAAGAVAAEHPRISHCYYRPSSSPEWPYTLYTMVHGRSTDECREVITDLLRDTPLVEYAVLESLQELKKTSMVYFQ